MTETELRFGQITLLHVLDELLRVQAEATDQLVGGGSSVTVDAKLSDDGRGEGSFRDTECDALGLLAGRHEGLGDESLEVVVQNACEVKVGLGEFGCRWIANDGHHHNAPSEMSKHPCKASTALLNGLKDTSLTMRTKLPIS